MIFVLLIAEDLGKRAEEVMFIDDREENLEAARKAGMKTLLFTSNKNLTKILIKL